MTGRRRWRWWRWWRNGWVVEEENRYPRRWDQETRRGGRGRGRGKQDGGSESGHLAEGREMPSYGAIRLRALVWNCLLNVPVVPRWLALAGEFVPVIVEHAFQLTSRCREAGHMHWVTGPWLAELGTLGTCPNPLQIRRQCTTVLVRYKGRPKLLVILSASWHGKAQNTCTPQKS